MKFKWPTRARNQKKNCRPRNVCRNVSAMNNSEATNAESQIPAERFMNRIMQGYTKPVRASSSINVFRNVSLVNIKMFAYMSECCPMRYGRIPWNERPGMNYYQWESVVQQWSKVNNRTARPARPRGRCLDHCWGENASLQNKVQPYCPDWS